MYKVKHWKFWSLNGQKRCTILTLRCCQPTLTSYNWACCCCCCCRIWIGGAKKIKRRSNHFKRMSWILKRGSKNLRMGSCNLKRRIKIWRGGTKIWRGGEKIEKEEQKLPANFAKLQLGACCCCWRRNKFKKFMITRKSAAFGCVFPSARWAQISLGA